MIVDTNVLIRLMQGDERATGKIASLESADIQLAISSVTLFELYHSIECVTDADHRRRGIEAVLDTKPIHPADASVMKKAGRIDGRLATAGRAIGMGDTIIAATATIHEVPVLTENVAHFDRIDDLEIESY